MAANGREIARNRALTVALGRFRIPLRAASACGLGTPKMANKTAVTIDVKIDLAKCLWPIAWVLFLLLS